MDEARSVADLGERGLLDEIKRRAPDPPEGEIWAGDDAALITAGDERLLIATDFMVEGVDFSFATASGADIGWKAMAINASDIAAMGGEPMRAVASAALRPDLPADVFDALLSGLAEGAAAWGAPVVGGDLGRADGVMVSVTMLGRLEGDPILRSGALVGDAICVTGSLGGSAGGLLSLQEGMARTSSDEALIARHLRPQARVSEALALRQAGPHAMIDISDGFALDLKRLLDASGCGGQVDGALLPLADGLEDLCARAGVDAAGLALTGGEDHELIFTVAPDDVATAVQACAEFGTPVTVVGEVSEGKPSIDGRVLKEEEGLGWDHLNG